MWERSHRRSTQRVDVFTWSGRRQGVCRTDRRAELKELLRSLRARLNPDDIGLPSYERRRARPAARGAASADGSVYAYYADLERGSGETMSVMAAVAHALRLT